MKNIPSPDDADLHRSINVIVADDHPVVAVGVASILKSEMDINVTAIANTISDLLSQLEAQPCDVLVCDYSFSGDVEPDGMVLFSRLKRQYPDVAIIVLTGHQEIALFVASLMRTGVAGFLGKSSQEIARLPDIVRSVHAGQSFIDQAATSELLTAGPAKKISLEALSEREFEVFRLLGRGMSVTEIAMHTNRSIKTISSQKLKAMHKLGARTETDLYRIYMERFG